MTLVIVQNKLPQRLAIALKGDDGKVVQVSLPPRGSTEPVQDTRVADYTKGLSRKGHVRIRQAS